MDDPILSTEGGRSQASNFTCSSPERTLLGTCVFVCLESEATVSVGVALGQVRSRDRPQDLVLKLKKEPSGTEAAPSHFLSSQLDTDNILHTHQNTGTPVLIKGL